MYHRAGSGEGWGDGCRQARLEEGVVYDDSEDATVLPPPVPGEGDPCGFYYPDQLSWGWLRSSLPLCPTLRQR